MASSPFRIGLNMAGAVSAGAYTAGVLDFFIEALDAWYDERASQGADSSKWNVPAHDVSLDVLTGASAGGMCAAISSIALQEEFHHVRHPRVAPGIPVNRLYQSWVQTIDVMPLLGSEDLKANGGVVRSILDCTPIEAIANQAIDPTGLQRKKRLWVSDQLALILTLSNLRGIPYSVDTANEGSFEERIAYHADQIEFISGNPGSTSMLPLDYGNPADPNWAVLRNAAMATGSFPVMLASRVLKRRGDYYLNKKWNLENSTPDDKRGCLVEDTIRPDWGTSNPATLDIVCADGGMTNNNPFECARRYLVPAELGAAGHNPRDAGGANAAVVSVNPFPGEEPFDPNYNSQEQSSLLATLKALIPALLSQSRFQGENLSLTRDPDVHSRFAIAPDDDSDLTLPALLCGALGAFGGFIDISFRDRDYQLGRRNCQQFLRVHFLLPEDNTVIAVGLAANGANVSRFAQAPPQGVKTSLDKKWYPVIPLMDSVSAKIDAPPRAEFKTTADRLSKVASAATSRLEAVVRAFLTSSHHHPFLSLLETAIFDFGGGSKLKQSMLNTLTDQLKKTQQV